MVFNRFALLGKYFIMVHEIIADGCLENSFHLMLLDFAVCRFLFSISPHLFTIFVHGNQIICIIVLENGHKENRRERDGVAERDIGRGRDRY